MLCVGSAMFHAVFGWHTCFAGTRCILCYPSLGKANEGGEPVMSWCQYESLVRKRGSDLVAT